MTIQTLTPSLIRPTLPLAPFRAASVPHLDSVSLTGASPAPSEIEQKKKLYKAVAWSGFGVEMLGGALTLAGNGALGLPLFAVGAAAIVYGEYKKNHA